MAQKIKSFIYLDEYKMYSISSQIFEGITESVIDFQEDTRQEKATEEVTTNSGRIIADILKSESGTQEKRFLHDYAYTLFEKYLRESEKIISISAGDIDEKISQIDNAGFVEVRGKAIFSDMNILKSTIENFNDLGKAAVYFQHYSQQQVRNQLDNISEPNRGRNHRQKQSNTPNIEKLAKEAGAHLDKELIKKLTLILDYGFQDQFLVRMSVGSYKFSADCGREDLRENEQLLVRKYGRISEKEFVLVGTVAQSSSKPIELGRDYKNYEFQSPKEAVMNVVEHLSALETQLIGRSANEIIIAPIAIYREI